MPAFLDLKAPVPEQRCLLAAHGDDQPLADKITEATTMLTSITAQVNNLSAAVDHVTAAATSRRSSTRNRDPEYDAWEARVRQVSDTAASHLTHDYRSADGNGGEDRDGDEKMDEDGADAEDVANAEADEDFEEVEIVEDEDIVEELGDLEVEDDLKQEEIMGHGPII